MVGAIATGAGKEKRDFRHIHVVACLRPPIQLSGEVDE